MPFARCSDLDRLLACSGDAVLRGRDEKSEGAREAATWGDIAHHWRDTGDATGDSNLHRLFRRKLEITGIRREQWWPAASTGERALAIDPELGLFFCSTEGGKAERDAWKAGHNDRFLTGSSDADWWMFDELYIDDLKTGKTVTWEDYQWQVTAYALGVAGVLGYRGRVHATLTHWPRYPVGGTPRRFGKVIEWEELQRFQKRLVILRDEIMRGRESAEAMVLSAGPQCLWCRSKSVCPEFNRKQERGVADE